MSSRHKKEAYLHFGASLIGGFLGGYTIVNHCDLLASAQTANLIHIVKNIFSTDHTIMVYLILSLLVYIAGLVFYVLAKKFIKFDIQAISLTLTSLAVVAVGCLPYAINDYLAMMPLIFALPVQWNAFSDCLGYSSSTIFSTNNLRQTVVSFTNYVVNKDEKQLNKAKFFGMTLASFHVGVALACAVHMFFGVESIWFCFAPIAVATGCYIRTKNYSFTFSAKSTVESNTLKAK